MYETELFTLPAGTICERIGIPFELAEDAKILCHPSDINLIRGTPVRGPVPTGSGKKAPLMTPQEIAEGSLPMAGGHE